ncbi:MAG: ribokinase [Candidatus Dormibacteraeota bacterium]|nr:ribokinase [Candidatus Dormibacteraeota bacterium]
MGRVAVLGSLNMDLVVRVEALPAPGQTVTGGELLTVPGGKGANQAVAAARLGARVRMVGRVGSDAHGEELIRGLVEDDVDVSAVIRDTHAPSGAALILVGSGGQNMIAVAPGANGRVGDEEVQALVEGLGSGDVVVMQLEIPLPAVVSAAEQARLAGARVLLNAAPSTTPADRAIPESDVLVVNEAEAADLTGTPVRDLVDAERAARRLGPSAAAVIVTMGGAGAVLCESGRSTRVAPMVVDAVDATAAGDAFVGAVAMGLAAGWSLQESVRVGSAAGAAAAGRLGARSSLPRPPDLERLFGLRLPSTPEQRS